MLILKGNAMKSDVIQSMMSTRRCVCYEYSDNAVVNGSVWINSTEHSLDDILDAMRWDLEVYNFEIDLYDYVVIYTQMRECDLQDFMYELRYRSHDHYCRQLILACMD